MTVAEHIAAVRGQSAGLTGFDWLDRDRALVAEIDRLRAENDRIGRVLEDISDRANNIIGLVDSVLSP